MAPKTSQQVSGSPPLEPPDDSIRLLVTPLSEAPSPATVSDANSASDAASSSGSEAEAAADVILVVPEIQERNRIPLEHNLRELLVQTTNTDRLETVTQIRLRVIAREITLQHLGLYLPSLRELILDGSIVSSLRDLGSCLKNLKILKVNRCDLSCIDGVFGFENLEELYVANNSIEDLSPCSFLTNIRLIDAKSNLIRSLDALAFLALCTTLEHLQMEGNDVGQSQGYRQTVKNLLPSLKTLDGIRCDNLEQNGNALLIEDAEVAETSTADVEETGQSPTRFTYHFAPRIFSNRMMSSGNREE